MLRIAQERKLDSWDINTLNQRIVREVLTSDALDTVIVMQKNKTRYLINCLQIENFAHVNNRDIIIFLLKHYQTKKDSNNLIKDELLFET